MRRLSGEGGAVLPMVALMMTALIGMSVLVVDVGALYWERRQLQNGADSGALAIAANCSKGLCGSYTTTAEALADANANDAAANVASITFPGGMAQAQGSVRVETSTAAAGSSVVAPLFARVLDPTYSGTTVSAAASAAWGGPAGLTSQLPITVSMCEYNQFAAAGLAPPPPYPPYPTERVIKFHTTSGSTCPAGPSGADLPGGFGWLDTAENCVATSTADGWFDASTGAPPPSSCSNAEINAMVGQIVHIPIYDQLNDLNGTNGAYRLKGYAAFYLTGYKFPSAKAQSIVTGAYPCAGSDNCISGWFTKNVVPVSGIVGGPSMGVTVVGMTG